MDFFEAVKAAQSGCPRLFATVHDRPWGSIFYQPANTLSVEANHAALWQPVDYAAALGETAAFYRAKACPPRLYAYLPPGEGAAFTRAAEPFGGRVTPSDLQLVTCRRPAIRPDLPPLQFEVLKEWDPALNRNVLGENLHLEGVLRGSMGHPGFSLVVGRLMGDAVTMASLWNAGDVQRISNVMTGEGFRGCGFGLALITHTLSLAAKQNKPVYLFANNPVALRLYRRAGMQVEQPDFQLFVWEGTA